MAKLDDFFHKNRAFLEEIIDPDFGLIDNLLSKGILKRREMKDIEVKDNFYKRNALLLDIITEKKRIAEFCEALKNTGQQHIVNYLKASAERSSQLNGNGEWPLTEREISILESNYESLVDLLDTCDLLGRLYSNGVINRRHLDFISSKSTTDEKNKALLEILSRSSLRSFGKTIICLRESNQEHIAQILETGETIVRVHATLDCDDLDETETQIVNEMTRLLMQRNVSTEQASRLLAAAQLSIIAVKRGQSVVLYVCCGNGGQLTRLCKIIDSLEMTKLLEQVFALCVHNMKIKVLTVSIYESDLKKARQSLEGSLVTISVANVYNPSISQDSEVQDKKFESEEGLTNVFDRHHNFIVDRIHLDFCLKENLKTRLRLTNKVISRIKEKRTIRQRNEMIIKSLTQKQKLKELFSELKSSDQRHLVNYLENDGEYSIKCGGEWPLTNKEALTIRCNYKALVDVMKFHELTVLLYQTAVINKEQREYVFSQAGKCEKKEALLEILTRGSLRSYWQTIRCLHQTNQSYIADLLEKGGVVVRVDVKLQRTKHLNAKLLAANIVSQLKAVYKGLHGLVNLQEISEDSSQVKLIGAKESRDISLYFACNQSNEIDALERMAKDGDLVKSIESLFNHLMRTEVKIKIELKWTSKAFSRSREIIQAICSETQISQMTPNTIDILPLEILEVIIQKSLALFIKRNGRVASDESYEDVFRHFAEVDFCWFKRMTNRRLKKNRWSYLSSICKSQGHGQMLSSYKRNRQFFDENLILLRDEAKNLKLFGHLGDIEYTMITRQSLAIKNAHPAYEVDLSFVMNARDDDRQNAFVRCLAQSEQNRAAKVLEYGGAAVRVEIKWRVSNRPQQRKEFVKWLNELQKDTNSRSSETETLIRKLKVDGIEILTSTEDRDVVVWLRCKSSKALRRMKEMNDGLDALLRLFCQLMTTNEECLHPDSKKTVNLDDDQLKTDLDDIVSDFSQANVEFEATLDVRRGEVKGVTKLRNEIFVICYVNNESTNSAEIQVFADRTPFNLLRQVQLLQIKFADDIISSEIENTLYVLSRWHCVWKVQQEEDIEQNVIKWLEFRDVFRPDSMTMTKDGQLLMVSSEPSPTLHIYGPDAQLSHAISLHEDIKRPLHAVESLTGNFVISHRVRKEENEGRRGDSSSRELTISVLSRDGKSVICTYYPGHEDQRLGAARYDSYLCIDASDLVLVADTDGHRVVLLDWSLRWKQILIPTNEEKETRLTLRSPHNFYYDEANRQLVVSGINKNYYKSDAVKVYALRL